MRIERIEIRDFRGFPGQYEFKLGKPGRNLLIYGENGSGKSSLFQALKQFFEASTDANILSQTNVFAVTPEPSIKLEIAAYDAAGNRDPDSGLFEWSQTANPANSTLIQQISKTKGCLDYRSLLEIHYIHRFKNRVEIFNLLTIKILTHVTNPVSNKLFGDEWSELNNDIERDMRGNFKQNYLKRLDQFSKGLDVTMGMLSKKSNRLLSYFFNDVKLILKVSGVSKLIGVGRNKYLENPKVFLGVKFYKKIIKNPHLFLNEARLSAVAIVLYLATLLIVPRSRLDLLVLDDLLIGIDMSNRMAVLHILQQHFKEWQIILMTHDRVWFETVRMSTLDEKNWWYGELFAEPSHNGIPTPLWRGHEEGWKSNLERAEQHLANHDDRAAGVYARAAFEGKLKKYCDKYEIPVPYKIDASKLNTDKFWNAIKSKLAADGKLTPIQKQLSEIEAYRKVVLNPLSHEHPTTLAHAEIQGAITAIKELDKVLK